jgi:hypothetical protein
MQNEIKLRSKLKIRGVRRFVTYTFYGKKIFSPLTALVLTRL